MKSANFRNFLPSVLLASFGLIVAVPNSHAAKSAWVIGTEARIHPKPDAQTPPVEILPNGTKIPVSGGTLSGAHGLRWYKTRSKSGHLGFVQAHAVMDRVELAALNKEDGLDLQTSQTALDHHDYSWSFVLRAMMMGGYEYTPTTKEPRGWGLSGEGEFSFMPFFSSRGYAHRAISLGVAYIKFKEEKIVAGSLIYRIFSQYRLEPEVRFRMGSDTQSGHMVLGWNAGVRYPLSWTEKAHLAAYTEGAGLLLLGPVHTFSLSFLAGLGFQF